VSSDLEAIDVDSDLLIDPWLHKVRAEAESLLSKLVIVRTPRPGLHVYYRCPAIGRNTKLVSPERSNTV